MNASSYLVDGEVHSHGRTSEAITYIIGYTSTLNQADLSPSHRQAVDTFSPAPRTRTFGLRSALSSGIPGHATHHPSSVPSDSMLPRFDVIFIADGLMRIGITHPP